MTKTDARDLFGPAFADLARGLGVKRAAVSRWPAHLTTRQSDWVIGAAVRLGRPLPADVVRAIVLAAYRDRAPQDAPVDSRIAA